MTIDSLYQETTVFMREDPCNYINEEDALREELIGMRLFEEPLIGVGDAADPIFSRYKDQKVVRGDYLLPEAWLPGARSVISVFLPFTERIRVSNRSDYEMPSQEWLHGRIEGQEALASVGAFLCRRLRSEGFTVCFPMQDPRFNIKERRSNWSERHTAFACGLGTFGMSKGIITEKGMAGRLLSIITDCALPVSQRVYSDIYEYCIKCGKCADNCPSDAIDKMAPIEEAKSHTLCSEFLEKTRKYPVGGGSSTVRYGCGKCQVGVPCECRRPSSGV